MKKITLTVLILGCAAVAGTTYYQAQKTAVVLSKPEQIAERPSLAQADSITVKQEAKQADTSQVALMNEIAELRKEINSIKNQPAPTQGKVVSQKPSMTNEERRQQAEAAQLAYFQGAGQHFSTQQLDGKWSGETTNRLETAIENHKEEGLHIDSVECRSSMCKLEIDDMDEKNMESFQKDFRTETADLFSAGIVGKDEFGKTIIYVARDATEIYPN